MAGSLLFLPPIIPDTNNGRQRSLLSFLPLPPHARWIAKNGDFIALPVCSRNFTDTVCLGSITVLSKTLSNLLGALQTQTSVSSGVRPMPWLGQRRSHENAMSEVHQCNGLLRLTS